MTSGIVPPARPENPPARLIFEARAGAETQRSEPEPAAADITRAPRKAEDGAEPVPPLPFCLDCAEAFFNQLEAENDGLPESERESRPALRLWAKVEAQKVRFCGEWVCPRCERIAAGTRPQRQLIPLQAALPNREARRSFEQFAGAAGREGWGR